MNKVIISGGGTGGHIFPAISIANALREIDPSISILFVGAKGKMEMDRVPQAGYEIVGLPVAGFHRKLNLYNICRNLFFPFRLLGSMIKAGSVIRKFKPDVVVGVGGYASGPVLRRASKKGIPCLIQEQNSYPGVTNKILAKTAKKICVAYPNMERFFDAEKIILTGNPVRQTLKCDIDRITAAEHFGLDAGKKVILVIGGSLGAKSINEGLLSTLSNLSDDVQLIWQTGKIYFEDIIRGVGTIRHNIQICAFIDRMDMAYSLANVVISRAGASSISELALLGKASILVPSPNVAEDHQKKNAMALVEKNAACLVEDHNCTSLLNEAQKLLKNPERIKLFEENILYFARENAAKDIAQEVINLSRKPTVCC